jgi:hypothetical protein
LVNKEKKTVNYVNNLDMVREILAWQEECRQANIAKKECPRQSDYIGRCILMICNRLASRGNFASYSYRDEFVSDAIEACINAVKSFDATRIGPKTGKINNAFNYLTMVAFHAMQRRILTERKQNAIKHNHYLHHFLISEINGTISEGGINEHTNRIISEFEEKHLNTVKKEKKVELGPKKNSSNSTNLARQSRLHVKGK